MTESTIERPRVRPILSKYVVQIAALCIVAAPFLIWPLQFQGRSFLSESAMWVRLIAFIVTFFISLIILGSGANIVIIVLRFGIPMAVGLYAFRSSDSLKPVRTYLITCIIWAAIGYCAMKLVSLYMPEAKIAMFAGMAVPVFIGLGSTGANKTNMSEFLASNRKYIKEEAMPELERVHQMMP